ncbi:MAG: MFS transporter [Thermoplasmata archaeon]
MATEVRAGAPPASPGRSLAVLIALRIGYAYNWFNVSAALPGIGAQFDVGPGEWGLLLAAFLVAAGVMQVPAGLLSRRFGARALSLAGAGLLGAASLAGAFAPSFDALLALRAVAGTGAALFFSPAIGLVAGLYPEGKRGLPLGSFTTAFSAGAALGVFGSALLVSATSWPVAFLAGGIGLLVLTGVGAAVIPKSVGSPARRPASEESRRAVRDVLRSPALWAIGIAFIGLEGAAFATGQFLLPFGLAFRGWSPALAGAIEAMFLLPSVAGGPLGGPLAERSTFRRAQLLIGGSLAGISVVFLPWAGAGAALAIGIVFAFTYGFVYSVMYVLPHYLPGLSSPEIPLAIGLFNSVQLAGGGLVALAFGQIVAASGYTVAWVALGFIVIGTLAAMLIVPRTGRMPAPPMPSVA